MAGKGDRFLGGRVQARPQYRSTLATRDRQGIDERWDDAGGCREGRDQGDPRAVKLKGEVPVSQRVDYKLLMEVLAEIKL